MKKSDSQKTIVLLDSHAIIHRAYHALPSFANSQGVPTGALYGLLSMIIRIIEDLKPDYIVAAYDLPKPTFRHHAYENYKAGRMKADDDLVTQLISSREVFNALGIPVLDAEGFEADDVIGTLVAKLKQIDGLSIIIASGDMDTLQLVDDKKVQVFTLKKGVNDTVMYDEAGVEERYGFKPLQLIDYKGLRGDPSDNIIGVPGIGEKTATTILQYFGTIEKMYEALEKDPANGKKAGLSDRIINLLLEHKDDAFFSKTLATIRLDAPIEYELPEKNFKESLDEKVVLDLLAKYEFSSLVARAKRVFNFEIATVQEDVDPTLLREASIALWVLSSEQNNPQYDLILERTRKKTLKEAYEVILSELKRRSLLPIFEKIEKPIIPIVESMTDFGIMIDQEYFSMLQERMKAQLAEIESSISEQTGVTINLNSPKQMSELLFTTLGLSPKGKKKASGAYTTNAEQLEELRDAHPVIPLILDYREIQKLLTTYVEALLGHVKEDGRVHATFLQNGAATGRFSSVNPNLQNIPIKGNSGKEIRHGFMAGPGNMYIGSDYSQIELRVLAMLSGDEKLIETFKKGEDIHMSVASSMFHVPFEEVTNDMRRKAKVINFGILYGMGITALQKNLGSTRAEAQTFYNAYFEAFPKIRDYLENTKAYAKEHGYTETIFGRRRYFPGINAGAPFLRAFAERMATNAPIQGTNADIVKIAIKLIDEDMKKAGLADKAHLILQIHDELVYEVEEGVQKEAEKIIEKAMVDVFERSPIPVTVPLVPLGVSIGTGKRLDELK
ncbi:MAG TPA: DNA polymerase [Candidatus Paceibacterota bacterium]|nr:DNA polymerase [Candidatus Paceibacterota bacterium]